MADTTFIYALCELGTRTVRYIGKTAYLKRRFRGHINTSSKCRNHLGHWIASVVSRGLEPSLIVLREVPHSCADEAERKYINLARRFGMNLVNSTDGGEGSLGAKPSEETRKKMSDARKGFRHSAETRAKLSAMKKGIPPSKATLLAKKKSLETWVCSEETRQKLSRAMTGRVFSPETIAKKKASAKSGKDHPYFGTKFPEVTRQKLRVAQTLRRLREKEAKSCQINTNL